MAGMMKSGMEKTEMRTEMMKIIDIVKEMEMKKMVVIKMEMMIDEELVSLIRKNFKNHEEFFLHLLICNSSYALDRHEYESSTVPTRKAFINVVPDKTKKTLTITNNGVGFTHVDLRNLGRMSTTSRAKVLFLEAAAASSPGPYLNQIWQFGLGFYFGFLVADKVVFRTKHYNDEEYALELDLQAGGSPTLTRGSRGLHRPTGSNITLYLKEDQLEYLEAPRLKALIKKHSYRIPHSISLAVTETSKVTLPAYRNQKKEKITVTEHRFRTIVQGS